VIKIEFNLSEIEFSRRDKEKGIIIPTRLTKELAEDIGIHLGDGSLYRNGSCKTLQFSCSGHIDERAHMEYIVKLKEQLYNIQNVNYKIFGNELRIIFHSYALAMFYTKVIGFPIGSKKYIGAPKLIMDCKDLDVIAGFLRGIIDTDFSLVIRKKNGKGYPTLQAAFASKKLILDLAELFSRLDILNYIELDQVRFHRKAQKYYTSQIIWISGFKRLNIWLKAIGFRNNAKYMEKVMGLPRFEFPS
jgi:hypothetical protein